MKRAPARTVSPPPDPRCVHEVVRIIPTRVGILSECRACGRILDPGAER